MCGEAPCTPCEKRKQDPVKFNAFENSKKVCDYTGFSGAGLIADFVKPLDKLPAWFAIQMYQDTLPDHFEEFELSKISQHVAVWTGGTDAYVAFRGTAIGQKGALQDIQDDLQIAFGANCNLQILNEAIPLLRELYSTGYRITLSGHSLGGKAALCLGHMPGVVNVVALNAGAPVTNPDYKGPGIGTHYHIVGDVISTHVYGMNIVRVTKRKDINWLDPWFHSTDRFFRGEEYAFVDAQFEQNELEDFFFVTGEKRLMLINALTSVFTLSWYGEAKDSICKNPVPGATQGRLCIMSYERGGHKIQSTLFGIAGGLLGLLRNPLSGISGAFAAQGLPDGDIGGLIGLFLPYYAVASFATKNIIERLIENSKDQSELEKELEKIIKSE